MSHIKNVSNFVAYATLFARRAENKEKHAHYAVVKAYDNLYKRQLGVGVEIKKSS